MLHLAPTSLVDEPIPLTVNLPPNTPFTLRATLVDDKGDTWRSWASYCTDARGHFSLAAAPLAGTYTDPDPSGLLWSMQPDAVNASLFRPPHSDFPVTLTLEALGQSLSARTWRQKGDPTLLRAPLAHGILFLPAGPPPHPAVIVLGGSGFGLSEGRAHLLASRGLAALALPYFNHPGLPPHLEQIPFEHFLQAFQALSAHPAIGAIGLWGLSRGAELALLLAPHLPLSALCATVPSSIAWGGLPNRNAPAWTYQNRPLPFTPFPLSLDPNAGHGPDTAFLPAPHFLHALEQAATPIPVEQIGCPLLLFSGGDDQMWPSQTFCAQIQERLARHHRPPALHLNYPKAGHLFTTPHYPTTRTVELHPVAKRWFNHGGAPREDAAARQDAWEQMLAFFETYLRS